MASAVLMPKVGISVESCIITGWLKKTGDRIEIGDVLFTYETDKSSMECESAEAGELLEIFCQEYDDVPVLFPVCAIGEPGEDVSALRPKGDGFPRGGRDVPISEPEPQGSTPASPTAPQVISFSADHSGEVKASPRAKRLAQRQHADLRYAEPSGPYGRVVEADVQKLIDSGAGHMTSAACAASGGKAAIAAGSGLGGRISLPDLSLSPDGESSGAGTYLDIQMSGVRRTIAKNMERSMFTIPQLTHHFSFDAGAMRVYREALKARPDAPNITLGDMVLFAAARVIKKYPEMNAHLIDGKVLRCYTDVNLGFAVDAPRGLLVPVIRQADKKTFPEIAAEARRLAGLAREGLLRAEDMAGGTFTVSNLGAFGVESFTPIINPPQVGILGLCCITEKLRLRDGATELYPAMGISLTYDHRALDGAPASRFAGELCRACEDFPAFLEREEG